MKELQVPTKSGVVLSGALFPAQDGADTIVIAITGVHGNFYSNPFYYNIGEVLSAAGIDFAYAQTRDAFGRVEIVNARTNTPQLIGSFNERFADAQEDVGAYIDYAERGGYRHIILAGHSLGANKVINYLANHKDPRVEKFILLSPANIKHMTSVVSDAQAQMVLDYVNSDNGQEMLPFDMLGWLPCIAETAYDWLFSDILNNVHVEADADFSQVERITHTGALVIGTLDRFTYGDPCGFLRNINAHMPTMAENTLVLIQQTGHTYQQKEQELAMSILKLVNDWRAQAVNPG